MTSVTVSITLTVMYVKLFSSIINSSIWSEDSNTCKVWITLMAMSDREGFVFGSVAGLARITALPAETIEAALKKFTFPDPHSSDLTREPYREGRKLETVAGGWKLLNGPWYRDLRDADERRFQNREAKKRERAAKKTTRHGPSASVVLRHPSESETESETESKEKRGRERFAPPSLEEIREYGKEIPGLNAEAFSDFYSSKGWKVGASMMKDWRAAARRWRRRDIEEGKVPAGAKPSRPEDEIYREDLARTRAEVTEEARLRKEKGLD